MTYINIKKAIFIQGNAEELYFEVTHNTQEACKLARAQVGFEYVTGESNDGGNIFEKRK